MRTALWLPMLQLLVLLALPLPGWQMDTAAKGEGDKRMRPEPPQRFRHLPSTQLGTQFHTCMVEFVDKAERTGAAKFTDVRVDMLTGPLSTYITPQFCERFVTIASNKTVQAFCETVNQPHVEDALRALVTPRKQQQRQRRPVKIADFVQPFTTDPQSGIFLPHDAEYSLTADNDALEKMMDALQGLSFGTVYSDTSGKSRSNTQPTAAAAIACFDINLAMFVANTVCKELGTAGTWEGVALGSWQAPLETACLVVQIALTLGYDVCDVIGVYSSFIDGLVDAAEIQAAYENAKKGLDNELILWRKIDKGQREVILMFEQLYKKLDDALTVVSTQNCELKTGLAEVQRENNYLRYLLLTPETRRPRFLQSTKECSLSRPEYCERAITKKPVQPVVFDPPAECKVSDGVRQFDLTQEPPL